MTISDADLKVAVKNMLKATNKNAEELFNYSYTYFGATTLSRLNTSDISMSFKLVEGEALDELLRSIVARCGCSVNFVHGEHLGGYIRWTCTGAAGVTGRARPVVIHTPIILDKSSAFLLMNKNITVESSHTYCAPRFDMPFFEFRNGKMDRLVINNNSSEDNYAPKFSIGLDKLYWAIKIQKLPDRELTNLKRTGNLLKHDLFLDYRRENIADDDHTAMVSRNRMADAAILYVARKQLDTVLAYSTVQDIKPWLIVEDNMDDGLSKQFYKNVYHRQKKYDAKVTTYLAQVRVASFYSQFVAAVYADAFIHQHIDEVPDALEKLNFPAYRIPVKCCCSQCMNLERKRGPQPKVDSLYYTDEYIAEVINRKYPELGESNE